MTLRRLDLAVKWRFFRSLLEGNDKDAERVYRWHIEKRSGARMRAGLATDQWKRSVDDYVETARGLLESFALMRAWGGAPVPVDPSGELLDGSHRVACALALGVEHIPAKREGRPVWAPSWGFSWFVHHGMRGDDLTRVVSDWDKMRG